MGFPGSGLRQGWGWEGSTAGLEGETGGGRFGAFTPEKGLEEGAAFDLEHAACDLAAVIKFGVLEEVHQAASCAILWGEAAENDAAYAGVDECASTHGAGFLGDVKVASAQAPVVDGGLRLCDGKHLGVGGGVLELFDLVVGPGDDTSLMDHDGADGNLVLSAGTVGEAQSFAHEVFVALEIDEAVFHEKRN